METTLTGECTRLEILQWENETVRRSRDSGIGTAGGSNSGRSISDETRNKAENWCGEWGAYAESSLLCRLSSRLSV
jgi:hypothetical protein